MPTNVRKKRPTRCRKCGATDATAVITYGELCTDCSIETVATAAREMAEKRGPAWEKWKRGMARAAREAEGKK